ncbi:choline transporter, partial [Exophiala viscosa]|uniref:choline transporter n=1 Tax=Exophiala viscosa TaxID=2486360 RepID=UPI00219F9135
GSSLAFNAISGSFVALISLSYLMAIFLYLLRGRQSAIRGSFHVKGLLRYIVGIVSCAYLAVMIIFYNFPYAMPVNIDEMNYSCVLFGAMVIFPGLWWIKIRKTYRGPPVEMLA